MGSKNHIFASDKGIIRGAVIVFNDITERRKKEKEVRQLMEESQKKAEALSLSAGVLESGLEKIAKGDLTFQAPIIEGDPLSKLKKDYNLSVDSIKKVIEELEKSVKQIEVTTKETSRGTTEISKSTEQVAVGTQKSADGAKKQLEIKARNIFIEESNEPNYYKGGDPPSGWALNTDIIARAFKEAGFDLRILINEDITKNFKEYPVKAIWNQSVPDIDIDYRRIQNMEVFFERNASVLTLKFDAASDENLNKWMPGDVVFFDMDEDGYSDNVGIISDATTRNGSPKIIYNYIDPGFTTEADILGSKIITGHYRYP